MGSKKANKGVFVWGWVVAVLTVVLIASNGYWVWRGRERMRVTRVIDGDTFVIKTGERVRLIGLDAPETGSCGSGEATKQLSGLILNRIIKIDRGTRDGWGRRLGIVTADGVDVNLEMVKSGWARYDSFSDEKSAEMAEAGRAAEDQKLGIYLCEKETACGILGNIDESSGKKYYHVPGCPSYGRVKIDIERGEKKFCTESEAKRSGFILAPDCVR
ncbi:MAG: nuclease [Microgenomates group bacterium Gr01-1014_16]|nr:MAG: nuclease [Microgenomates group bacterium Gr01-1014_16]